MNTFVFSSMLIALLDGSGNQTGSWGGYTGNQYSPTSGGTYTVQGNEVSIRVPDSNMRCAVHFRQQDGRTTELKCGDQLWGAGLCE
jgi:hypothetical protein